MHGEKIISLVLGNELSGDLCVQHMVTMVTGFEPCDVCVLTYMQ